MSPNHRLHSCKEACGRVLQRLDGSDDWKLHSSCAMAPFGLTFIAYHARRSHRLEKNTTVHDRGVSYFPSDLPLKNVAQPPA